MTKFLSKAKWYIIVGVIALILFFAFFVGVKDKNFYKDIFKWYFEEDKKYQKKIIEHYSKKDSFVEEDIQRVDEKIKEIDKKKKDIQKQIDEADEIEMGEMFKNLGY